MTSTTQTTQTTIRTPLYTPAQTSNIQQSVFTINTIHTILHVHSLTSRKLLRPP